MASLQQLQSRRKAVRNVGQITKAMEVVATTKMRKSQEVALSSRPYAYKVLELLDRISANLPEETPLTKVREVERTLVLIITSDRGLIGSFNAQVFRKADEFFANDTYKKDKKHKYVALNIGRKATNYCSRNNIDHIRDFEGFADFVRAEDIEPCVDIVIKGFLQGEWDRVITVSANFISTLKQDFVTRQLLPVDFERVRETVRNIVPEHGRHSELRNSVRENVRKRDRADGEYIFEPTAKEALDLLVPHLVRMQFFHLVLEANACEHSARRVAMKAASDNASELSDILTLGFNKARQSAITNEIIEITSTQSALV